MTRRKAYWALLILGVISILFALKLPDLRFNYVFEDFFPVDDPELVYYQEFKEKFGEDNNYLLIGIRPDNGEIFESSFLKRLDTLTSNLESLKPVKAVRSLANFERPVITPTGLITIPVIHPEDPSRRKTDSLLVLGNPLLRGNLVSTSGNAVALILNHENFTNGPEPGALIDSINVQMEKFGEATWHVAGKVHAQRIFISTMQRELIIFLSASLVLIVIFLAVAYRAVSLIILPLIVVLLGAVWILGIMAISGKPLDILMVLLPTIMFVVGMSDVVHIMTKYIEQLRSGRDKRTAIRVTFREVGMATFLTSLTTAIGFFTLLTASIRPIREFGIYTGIGVFIAFIVAFTLIPSSLSLMKPPAISAQLYHRSGWFNLLSKAYLFVLRNARAVIIISLLIIPASLYGIQKIYINTYLIEDLPSDHPLKEDFTFFDQNFGGSRPFEMTIEASNGKSLFDRDVLNQMAIVHDYLETTYEAGNVAGPLTVVRALNQASAGGSSEAFGLPENEAGWRRIERYLPRILKSENTREFISENGRTGRITGRIEDIGSSISLARTDSLRQFIRDNVDGSIVSFTVTGTSNLIDKNNEYLARNMFNGLGIAFAVVALIAGLLFRSFRMILITLIPNVIPLLVVAAIMGVTGITLKLSTSIVFTIAFGIAVDDTIHFISKLRIELLNGSSLLYALKRTYLSTGKALIVTSIILSGGFLTLLLSSFGGTFYTGLLISLTLIFALVADLTLLPVLVYLFYPARRKSTKVIEKS